MIKELTIQLRKLLCFASFLLLFFMNTAEALENSTEDSNLIISETGRKVIMRTRQEAAKVPSAALPITYHGGSVLDNCPYIYLIFYGNFTNSTTPQILTDLISNQTGLLYWTTLRTYYSITNGIKYYMTDSPKYGAVVYDTSYSQGTSLTDSAIQRIVINAIQTMKVPLNSNAMYFVLTSADVTATSGLCTTYCGWHTATSYSGTILKYAYVGSPLRCPNACSYNQNITPNNNREADGMASIIMHEIAEMMTDPLFNGWYDSNYYENADKCAWTFGTKYTTANGAQANMRVGKRDFLIQQDWNNTTDGYCSLSYP